MLDFTWIFLHSLHHYPYFYKISVNFFYSHEISMFFQIFSRIFDGFKKNIYIYIIISTLQSIWWVIVQIRGLNIRTLALWLYNITNIMWTGHSPLAMCNNFVTLSQRVHRQFYYIQHQYSHVVIKIFPFCDIFCFVKMV